MLYQQHILYARTLKRAAGDTPEATRLFAAICQSARIRHYGNQATQEESILATLDSQIEALERLVEAQNAPTTRGAQLRAAVPPKDARPQAVPQRAVGKEIDSLAAHIRDMLERQQKGLEHVYHTPPRW
jgi:hypothetical protein